MTIALRLAALLLLAAPSLHAEDIDLSNRIASGKWLLTYQRVGELKPLRLKQKENGTSHTCIAGDARDKIIDWVAGKGCVVEKESLTDGVYRLDGQCRLKFWKGRPVPVSVELRPETPTRFGLTIQTRDNSLFGYTEHTRAVLEGPCDPPTAVKGEPVPRSRT